MLKSLVCAALLKFTALCSVTVFEEVQDYAVYTDQELDELWNSFDNLHCPTVGDYQRFETYLQQGRRAYLDDFFDYCLKTKELRAHPGFFSIDRSECFQTRILQKMRFIGKNLELPSFNVLSLNQDHGRCNRCVIIYVSHNFDQTSYYADKLEKLICSLRQTGFKGDVLVRVGGYPLLQQGGMKLAHIPYSFKVLSFLEAELLGYDAALWIDSAIAPTQNINFIFDLIEKNGYFLLKNGHTLAHDYNEKLIPDRTLDSWNLTPKDLGKIPHIISGIMGVSFHHDLGRAFLKNWYLRTAQTFPAISLYPEEFLVCLASWELNIRAMGEIGGYLRNKVPYNQCPVLFWHDKR